MLVVRLIAEAPKDNDIGVVAPDEYVNVRVAPVKVNPAVLNVPLVIVSVDVPIFKAAVNDHEPVVAKVIELARVCPQLIVLPVPAPLNVIAPVYVLLIPVDAIVKSCVIQSCADPANTNEPDAGPLTDKL